MEGPLDVVVDLVDDKRAVTEDAVAAMGLDLTCANIRVSSCRRPTMTGCDKHTKLRRHHGLWWQHVKAACSLIRVGPLGLLASVSNVELAPRLSSSVVTQTFLVTRISGQAKTPGPTSGHFLVKHARGEDPRAA